MIVYFFISYANLQNWESCYAEALLFVRKSYPMNAEQSMK
jgi:hypothetical protein